MNTQPNREETLFHAALLLPPAERTSYLAKECFGDAALRQRVEELIQAHLQASDFLEQHPTEIAQPGVETPAPEGRIRLGTGGTKRMERATEKPGDVIDRYKLLQKLGEGGCGTVYMAEQSEPVRRKVALKVIKLGMDTKEVVARFEAERQALAMMDHPNIAKVLDGGATNTGRPYFVMELVRGIPITQYCDENNLATPRRLDLFIKVCQAVQHAHQKGIIHRDLKPSNIMVTLHDGVPVPKVIDFGIAKATDQSLTDKTLFTELHAFMGTPAYTSPEQAEMSGLDIDTRADIYSLGVLLYELLTGKLPFNPETLMKAGLDEMRRTIREVEPPRPSTRLMELVAADVRRLLTAPVPTSSAEAEIRASSRRLLHKREELVKLLRGDLDWIVMKALEKDRTRRYDTANSFAQDIQRYLGNEAVLACPPSFAYVFTKLVRRHKLACAAVAAVTVTLIGGIVVSLWQANEARQARDGERQQRTHADTERGKAVVERDRADAEADGARRLLYSAHMNLAKRAWDDASVGRTVELLDLHRPQPGRPDLRGFEWFYLNRLCHSELLSLKGHTGVVSSVAFSADGKRLASASQDGTVKVWDATSGEVLLTLKGHFGAVRSVAFSPDGKRLASAGDDATVRVWDATSGQETLTLKGHAAQVYSVAFSPDGKRLASASQDGTLKMWDATSGQEMLTLKGHTYVVRSVAFSPDGKWLASASWDQTVKVWDAVSGEVLLTLKGNTGPVETVAFSPNGKRLATTSLTQTVKVWDATSGQETLTLQGNTKTVTTVAFSPDGKRLASASEDGTVKVWDATSGQEMLTVKGHTHQVNSVAFSPDGKRLASASWDKTVKVWDVTSYQETLMLKGHTSFVMSVAFSPDGKRLASASYDQTVKVWDATSGQETLTLQGNAGPVLSVAFSPDGKRLASAGKDSTVKVWDAASGEVLLTLKGHNLPVTSVVFSPDGKRLASASGEFSIPVKPGEVKVWDAASGKVLLTLKGHTSVVGSVAFSPDGKRLASAGDDVTVKVWDVTSGQEMLKLKGQFEGFTSVAFSPDGKRLASASWDKTVKVWDATNGQETLTLKGHTAQVHSLAFSPDGKRLGSAGGHGDNTVKVWDATSGQEMLTLKGHTSTVQSVVFSPDGKRLASASNDGTVKVWDATPRSQDNTQ